MEQKWHPIKKRLRDLTVNECIEAYKGGLSFICEDGQIKYAMWTNDTIK